MRKKILFVETFFLIFDCQYSTVNIHNPESLSPPNYNLRVPEPDVIIVFPNNDS